MEQNRLKNDSSAERPLDPTTARVVSELAAALLPRLQETLAGELAAAARAMPQNAGRDVEEILDVLRRLKEAGELVFASLNSVGQVIEQTTGGTRFELERLRGELESLVARMRAGGDIFSETTALLRSMEAAIPGWEGFMKADAHARTRELSEFSAEISELLRDTQSNLFSTLGEAVAKESSRRDERMEQLLRESERRTERRLAKLQKYVVASAVVSAILFAAIFMTSLT